MEKIISHNNNQINLAMDILQKKLASEDEAYKPTAFWTSLWQHDLNYSRGLSYRRICISH